jgi:tRNA 2-thiocytidine biosynthesis protein TtcA
MGQCELFSLVDKAVYDYQMIEPADRILVGLSGGKDSTALIEYFVRRYARLHGDSDPHSYHHGSLPVPFSFTAFHIETDFSEPLDSAFIDLLHSWNVIPVIKKIPVLQRIKAGQRMNCWWCSTQRRRELVDYALKNGYTKIALGHHLDDILETCLMNMLLRGKLETMPPVLRYHKYPLSVIRPLCYVPVSAVVAHADLEGWRPVTCTCSYQDNSGRMDARRRLESLTGGDDTLKMRLFQSLRTIDREYLP